MPIQLILYTDRLEVRNPGGLYGRLTVDELGNVQPDTRNPVLVTAMEFSVCLYNGKAAPEEEAAMVPPVSDEKELLDFCVTPRSRKEIIEYLAIPSAQYALRHYLDPLVQAGAIRLSIPEKPRSPNQRYQTAGMSSP